MGAPTAGTGARPTRSLQSDATTGAFSHRERHAGTRKLQVLGWDEPARRLLLHSTALPSFQTTQSDVYMLRTVKDPLHRNEVPQSSRSSCFTMCVPRRWRQTPLWRALLGEFSGPVWALVLATYLAVYAALLLDTHRAAPSPPTPTRALKQRRIGFDLLAAVFGSVSLSSLGHGHGHGRSRVSPDSCLNTTSRL